MCTATDSRSKLNLVSVVDEWQCLCLESLLDLSPDLIVFRGSARKRVLSLHVTTVSVVALSSNTKFLRHHALSSGLIWRLCDHQRESVDTHLLQLLFVLDFDQEADLLDHLCIRAELAQRGSLLAWETWLIGRAASLWVSG